MITWQMVRDRWNREAVYTKPEFWDDAAKNYRDTGTNIWVNPHINELFHDLESGIVHGWIKDCENAELLDLGCGAGRFSREFAKRGARVTAVDFSSKSIDIARRMTDASNVQYRVGSVFDLDAENAYDIVVCAKVLTIACKDKTELRQCLAKIRRALKPGGQFASIEMCHTNFSRRVLAITFADYQAELKAAGFEVLDTKVAEFIPTRMALAFFEFPRWFTSLGFKAGEFAVKLLPIMSDQKFTYCRRT